jgi:predicted nucleic acid-binding protein
MILGLKDLPLQLSKDISIKLGCMVDTNVLFAASYPPDIFNDWAEEVFDLIHKLEIPIYTNINVRSEFLDLHRRVLIPEGLLTLLHDFNGSLGTEIETQLRLLRARFQKALDEDKAFKLQDSEIKKYRKLLSAIQLNGENAWSVFCETYLHPYIEKIWDDTVAILKIKFLGTREMDNKEIFDGHPSWADLVQIIGKSGIGTADAMIINLFQKSKLTLIVTADGDVKDTVLTQFAENRYILAPT